MADITLFEIHLGGLQIGGPTDAPTTHTPDEPEPDSGSSKLLPLVGGIVVLMVLGVLGMKLRQTDTEEPIP